MALSEPILPSFSTFASPCRERGLQERWPRAEPEAGGADDDLNSVLDFILSMGLDGLGAEAAPEPPPPPPPAFYYPEPGAPPPPPYGAPAGGLVSELLRPELDAPTGPALHGRFLLAPPGRLVKAEPPEPRRPRAPARARPARPVPATFWGPRLRRPRPGSALRAARARRLRSLRRRGRRRSSPGAGTARRPRSPYSTRVPAGAPGGQAQARPPLLAPQAHRHAHLQLRGLRQDLHQELAPQGAPAHAHRREALSLHVGRLWLEVRALGRADPPLPQAHGPPALPVPPVRPRLLALRPPGAAHEATPVAPGLRALGQGGTHAPGTAPSPPRPHPPLGLGIYWTPRTRAGHRVATERGCPPRPHLGPPRPRRRHRSGPHRGLEGPLGEDATLLLDEFWFQNGAIREVAAASPSPARLDTRRPPPRQAAPVCTVHFLYIDIYIYNIVQSDCDIL